MLRKVQLQFMTKSKIDQLQEPFIMALTFQIKNELKSNIFGGFYEAPLSVILFSIMFLAELKRN